MTEEAIREHVAFLEARTDRNRFLEGRIKDRLRSSVHEVPDRVRRMAGRAVACMLLLILFILVHSAWIGRVIGPADVAAAGDPYGELFQSDSVTDVPFSGVWQWGR